MANEIDQKTLIELSKTMGQVLQAVGDLKEDVNHNRDELKEHRSEYNDGREKAREAHQQVVALVNTKLDRAELATDFPVVGKLQWLWDNKTIIVIIIGLLMALGFLSKGEKFDSVKEILNTTVKDGKKINK